MLATPLPILLGVDGEGGRSRPSPYAAQRRISVRAKGV
jgi:hypothetical protein